MKKLKIPQNLTALAYESIKQYLLSGGLESGARLTEESLSTSLGISKSPIREALNRLEAEGFIRIEPRRGAYLQEYSEQDINDLYDLRNALEKHVVATAKLTPDLFAELSHSVQRMRKHLKDNNKVRYIEEDISFHARLANATGNSRLRRTLENVQNQIWIYRWKTYAFSSSNAAHHHEAILSALEAGERRRAERLMSKHINTVRQKLVDFLEREKIADTGALAL